MRQDQFEPDHGQPTSYDEVVGLLEQGRISVAEAFRLLRDIEVGGPSMAARNILPTPAEFDKLATLDEIMAELESLIGLAKVKKLVKELQAFIQIQKAREAQHLATEPMVLHMIFKGNPLIGRGKRERFHGGCWGWGGFRRSERELSAEVMPSAH